MKKYLTILIFILFLCLANQSEARKLALLVGVDDYDNINPLHCCVNDMKTLKSALMKIGFDEGDIQVLTTGSRSSLLPTKEKIERKVEEIISQTQSSSESTEMVFLAFSGHGMREKKVDYFCPIYADPDDIPGTCVSITQVMEDLAQCQAEFKWMVVDACRTGAKDARSIQVISTSPDGIALFQSCGKGESSYEEKRDGGNGYFTKNLAAAISGAADTDSDGVITLMDVVRWTTRQTKAEVLEAKGKTQTPFLRGSISDVTLTEDLNFPKAEALAQEAQAAMDAENYDLAVEKYDAALALCPHMKSWKRERAFAKRFDDANQKLAEERKRQEKQRETPPSTYTPHSGSSSSLKAGDRKVLTVDGIEYAFRWCPPGEFMMGSSEYSWEKQHRVRLTQGFWLLETEVTQEMWESVMGENPSRFKGARKPVEEVSWDDSQAFCEKLSRKLNREIKLTTEAQWEYACRAGTTGAYAGDLASMGWYRENSGDETHEVGQKRPNAWGLYDMHGNVWEWCSDYFDGDYYAESPTSDPENTSSSPVRVNRGGGWCYGAGRCRSASRDWVVPGFRCSDLGLRVLLVPSSRD